MSKLREAGGIPNEPEEQSQPQEQPTAEYPLLHPLIVNYMFGAVNWMQEASSQLYIEPPHFSQQFAEAALQSFRIGRSLEGLLRGLVQRRG